MRRAHIGISLGYIGAAGLIYWCFPGLWCSRAHIGASLAYIGAAGVILLAYLVLLVQQGSQV